MGGRPNTGNLTEAKAGCLDSRAKLACPGTAHHAERTAEALAGKKKVWRVPWRTEPIGVVSTPPVSLGAQGRSGRVIMYATV